MWSYLPLVWGWVDVLNNYNIRGSKAAGWLWGPPPPYPNRLGIGSSCLNILYCLGLRNYLPLGGSWINVLDNSNIRGSKAADWLWGASAALPKQVWDRSQAGLCFLLFESAELSTLSWKLG